MSAELKNFAAESKWKYIVLYQIKLDKRFAGKSNKDSDEK